MQSKQDPRSRGLDRTLQPHGFWDEFISGNVAAIAILGLLWFRTPEALSDSRYFIAFVIGLFFGQCLSYLFEISRQGIRNEKVIRLIRYLSVVAFVLVLVWRSGPILFGFLLGAGLTVCLGMSLAALCRRLASKSSTK